MPSVRTLLAGEQTEPAIAELGHGLAFWAARFQPLPSGGEPAGQLSAAATFLAVPRLADQSGFVAYRLGRLAQLPSWPQTLRGLCPPATPADVPAGLADLVDVATVRYQLHGAASPVLLVHTATAPNAVRHTLPALPESLWPQSFTAAWTAAAAITACYAPLDAIDPVRDKLTGPDPIGDALATAARHGDEHVLKFTDTAVEVYQRTGDPAALTAAQHAAHLIDPT
ncbi:hypothetical protein [Fodinicola feengrottensis]|uniref:hypothetical protein n=1 Tax=Fodinicola feengrottensis TaxID=435914 RepID=UPI0024425BB7|nr:hypothetical protein [Fodinicola feengrottensis]